MKFKTVKDFSEVVLTEELVIYLIRSKWNDWWKYENSFSMYICQNKSIDEIGNTKIANLEESYQDDNKTIIQELPSDFPSLTPEFVSLGQDASFYSSLDSISDDVRDGVLNALNDLAYKQDIFEKVINNSVVRDSILRDVSATSVRGQYKKLAKGRAELTRYNFQYTLPKPEKMTDTENELYDDAIIDINVEPFTQPSTNLHVIVGRNGVGKTHLLKNLVSCLLVTEVSEPGKYGQLNFEVDENDDQNLFANILTVSFSGFDNSNFHYLNELNNETPYFEISLLNTESKTPKTVDDMTKEFTVSLEVINRSGKSAIWRKSIRTLNSDPIFEKLNIEALISQEYNEEIPKIFKKLSSGHMYVLITVTQLVEKLEERSIVIMDEPETHLHPPLIASLMRVLTDLLIFRNAVGLLATHSPVVVQEVPKSCVTIIDRNNKFTTLSRPTIQTFGENVGTLTREIFRLEINYSGFHKRLSEAVDKHNTYEEVLKSFNNQLGAEARTVVRSLLLFKEGAK